MKKLFLILVVILPLVALIGCGKLSKVKEKEDSYKSMLSNWIADDTTINIGSDIKSFEIIDEVDEKLYKESYACVSVKIKFADSYNKRETGTIYARMDCEKYGNIYVDDSIGKLAIMVDSVFISGRKVLKDTTCLNSIFFLNDKISPKRADNQPKRAVVNSKRISLKEYATELYDSGMHNISITDDGILIFTMYNEATGDLDYKAESIYNEAKGAGVYDIRGVRVVKNGDVVGRYIKHF